MKGGQAGAFRTGQMGHEMRPIHYVRGRERALAGAAFRAKGALFGDYKWEERARLFSLYPKLLLTTHLRAMQPTKDRLLAKAGCKNEYPAGAISPCQL